MHCEPPFKAGETETASLKGAGGSKEGGGMANDGNLKPVRTKSEARERGRNGGKASGVSRRRKADFRKTLNLLLTMKIEDPEWEEVLEAAGLECTVETKMNAAIIAKAMNGDVKAYEAVARYAGQSGQTEADEEEQHIRIERDRAARDAEIGNEEDVDEGIQRFLKAVKPSQEELDKLFGDEEENDDEEKEE